MFIILNETNKKNVDISMKKKILFLKHLQSLHFIVDKACDCNLQPLFKRYCY